MELGEAVKKRRSIHEYEPKLVEEDVLKNIFRTAAWAPTHRMKEPWNVHLYQEKGKERYAEAVLDSYERQGFFQGYDEEKSRRLKKGIGDFLLQIPHHALIYMPKDEDERKFEEDYAAVCAYVQNVQLLAWEAGVGVLWTTSPYLHDPEFAKGVGLDPSFYKLVSVLQIGYPKRIPKAKQRTDIGDKMKVIRT
ncbi:nitroreductase family protein [Halobacillus kuroshimensis]|uniref:nitroreductase family protein n=1 Tax=Halobacillus kuroshimensis TaxID=302481 RepID=UPI0003F77DA4|nr:nitroreductase [Halobacillus kuroshimensis]